MDDVSKNFTTHYVHTKYFMCLIFVCYNTCKNFNIEIFPNYGMPLLLFIHLPYGYNNDKWHSSNNRKRTLRSLVGQKSRSIDVRTWSKDQREIGAHDALSD